MLTKEVKWSVFVLLCYFSLGIVSSIIEFPSYLYQTEEIFFIMTIIIWMITVRRRLVQHNSRAVLISMGILLGMLFVLRSLKYYYVSEIYGLGRYLWYLYYIPLIYVPVQSLHAALTIHRPEGIRKKKFVSILYIVAGVLVILVLTNESHQLVFKFENTDMQDTENYTRYILYYVIFVWIIGLQLGSMYVAFDKCRIKVLKKRILIPVIFTVVLYLLLPLVQNFSAGHSLRWLNFQECFLLLMIGIWEMYLDIGLIRTNNNFESFFSESAIHALITNKAFEPVFSSSSMRKERDLSRRGEEKGTQDEQPGFTDEQLKSARNGIIYIDDNTRLHCHEISAGYFYWTDDISEISRLNNLLQDVNEQLAEEKNLIQQENELKAMKASYEIQNRLYDNIAEHLRPSFDRISRLLDNMADDDFDNRLATVCVMGTYVKRYSNLILIAESNGYIDLKELYLSVRESMEYLNLCGIICTVTEKMSGDFHSKYIIEMFEIYERVAEKVVWSGASMMVNLTSRETGDHKELEMKIMLEIESGKNGWTESMKEILRDEKLDGLKGKLWTSVEDDCFHISLLFEEGGAEK